MMSALRLRFYLMAFKVRFYYFLRLITLVRHAYFSLLGMQIGNRVSLPRLRVTWPHQVSIGDDCRLEHNIYFKFDGIAKPGPSIRIGADTFIGSYCEFNINKEFSCGSGCLIASGCIFVDHDHTLNRMEAGASDPEGQPIRLGRNVWLGARVTVLKGVTIGDGATVAAGAVVTKSIPPGELWGGVPARKIRSIS